MNTLVLSWRWGKAALAGEPTPRVENRTTTYGREGSTSFQSQGMQVALSEMDDRPQVLQLLEYRRQVATEKTTLE